MKAIDTEYKGYLFRSRLEARWAVFFDALGIRYEYEKEGFDLGEFGWYLPDFWIQSPLHQDVPEYSDWGFWCEIKPTEATQEVLDVLYELVVETRHNALIFQGNPWFDEYTVTKISGHHQEIPEVWHGMEFCYDDTSKMVHLESDEGFGSHPIVYPADKLTLKNAYKAARSARFEHREKP